MASWISSSYYDHLCIPMVQSQKFQKFSYVAGTKKASQQIIILAAGEGFQLIWIYCKCLSTSIIMLSISYHTYISTLSYFLTYSRCKKCRTEDPETYGEVTVSIIWRDENISVKSRNVDSEMKSHKKDIAQCDSLRNVWYFKKMNRSRFPCRWFRGLLRASRGSAVLAIGSGAGGFITKPQRC